MKKCLGCGELLQNSDKNKKGYVVNLDNDYCLRCFKIKHYNELVLVDDIKQADFVKEVNNIIDNANKNDHFFYILDVFNLDSSRVRELENKLSADNTTIVINKIDLLPRDLNFDKLMEYVMDVFKDSKIKDAEIVLISTTKLWGVDELRESVEAYKNNYFIGKSNVGKSSIINAMMKSIGNQPLITESYYANTTLDLVEIELNENCKIIDTPGIAQDNSFCEITKPDDWNLLYFKKELKQFSFNIFSNQSFVYGSIFAINFALVDKRDIHIYVNQNIDLHRTNTKNAEEYLDKNWMKVKPQVISKPELVNCELDLTKIGHEQEISISIQDLGWISLKIKSGDKINYTIASDKIKPLIEIRKKLM